MFYIGIDPGVSGGIAILDDSGKVIEIHKMPETNRDILVLFGAAHPGVPRIPARAVLERVSASPQMGTVSAFTFGKGYGGLRMALAAGQIPYDEVAPLKWQNAMGCAQPRRAPGEPKKKIGGKDKNISKRRAQELFPAEWVTHSIADALLLAEYCRRKAVGEL